MVNRYQYYFGAWGVVKQDVIDANYFQSPRLYGTPYLVSVAN